MGNTEEEVETERDEMKKCACCGNESLEEDSLFEICEICGWQQDVVMEDDPDYTGGANYDLSLNEAKKYWTENHNRIPNELFHKHVVK